MSTSIDCDSVAEIVPNAGGMRSRVRQFDWAATPLGPADKWSDSLRTE